MYIIMLFKILSIIIYLLIIFLIYFLIIKRLILICQRHIKYLNLQELKKITKNTNRLMFLYFSITILITIISFILIF